MKRRQLSEKQLVAEIGKNVGPSTKRIASRLLRFAHEIEAEPVFRHNSISIRFRLFDRAEKQWLTLFVITTVGTFYCGWLYRWHEEGFPIRIEHDYENNLKSALSREVVCGPRAFNKAVPLKDIYRKWTVVTKAVRQTVHKLQRSQRQLPKREFYINLSAVEGLAIEQKMTRYGRSRALRDASMRLADGICSICHYDFKNILGGRGKCVLQVHHLKQLSARDRPRKTLLNDLLVVCANCHLLLHSDRGRPLSPSSLRTRLLQNF
jgi:hypothetical protein